jgi:hypothetical protein
VKANVIVINPRGNVAIALENVAEEAEVNDQGGILCLYAMTPAF